MSVRHSDRDERVLERIRVILRSKHAKGSEREAVPERLGRVIEGVLFPDRRVIASVHRAAAVGNFEDDVAVRRRENLQRLHEFERERRVLEDMAHQEDVGRPAASRDFLRDRRRQAILDRLHALPGMSS